MKPKTVILSVLVCFALFGLLLWGYSKNGNTAASVQGVESSGAKSELVASDTLYDFGTISMKNGNVTKDFTVTNPTDRDINVPSIETSCMCTTAFIVEPDGSTKGPFGMQGMSYVPPANELIKVGESRTLRVVYDPNAHGPAGVGQIDRFVMVMDSSGGMLRLEVKALVTP